MGHLEALCALAAVARTPGYCRPRFATAIATASATATIAATSPMASSSPAALAFQPASPRLILKAARHPMLEAQLAGKGEVAVPNDICLEWDGERVAIITGPNMGGQWKLHKLHACG